MIAIQGGSTTTEKERVLAGTYHAHGKWAGIEVELPFRIATVGVTGGGKRPFARVLSTHVLQLSLGLNPGPRASTSPRSVNHRPASEPRPSRARAKARGKM